MCGLCVCADCGESALKVEEELLQAQWAGISILGTTINSSGSSTGTARGGVTKADVSIAGEACSLASLVKALPPPPAASPATKGMFNSQFVFMSCFFLTIFYSFSVLCFVFCFVAVC